MIPQSTTIEKIHTKTMWCATPEGQKDVELVTLNSRGVREEKNKKKNFWGFTLLGRYSLGRGSQISHPFKFEMQEFEKFSTATHSFLFFIFSDLSWMRQLLLHSILLCYFNSKIFHFLFQQIKATLCYPLFVLFQVFQIKSCVLLI